MSKLLYALGNFGDDEDVEEVINLQPKNSKAKPYQVKQIRELIVRYHLEV